MRLHSFAIAMIALHICLVSNDFLSNQKLVGQEVVVQQPGNSNLEPAKQPYNFRIEKSCSVNLVQDQGRTGTCWCFATASFIEAEMIREGRGAHNFSEVFAVKNVYRDKARNYLLRQGKAQFSQGALAHDFLNAVDRYGLVPESVYDGKLEGSSGHDHSEMESVLKGIVEALAKRKSLSLSWEKAINGVLDAYLGKSPDQFQYQGQYYTPLQFAQSLGFQRDKYLSITSYNHHPFGKSFVLEIPDNYSNGSFLNLPIGDLVATTDNAIARGYTVAWDGDVSEAGFSSSKGIAVLPVDPGRKDRFEAIGPEKNVTQEDRQKTLMSFKTTDDHLMHLVGISRDAAGNKYYVIKNSWGDVGPYNGYLHLSEAYFRAKTVAIIVNREALVRSTAQAR